VLPLLAVSVVGCTTSAGSSTGAKGYITGDGAVTTIDVGDRKQAPDLSGEKLGGGTVSLSEYDGQVSVVNVWASWCGPCRDEADDLVEVAEQLPEVGFLGINFDDTAAEAEAFVRSHDVPYPSLVSEDGSALLAFDGLLTLSSLPSTVVIDTDGGIAALVTGPLNASTLAGLVDDVQAES